MTVHIGANDRGGYKLTIINNGACISENITECDWRRLVATVVDHRNARHLPPPAVRTEDRRLLR